MLFFPWQTALVEQQLHSLSSDWFTSFSLLVLSSLPQETDYSQVNRDNCFPTAADFKLVGGGGGQTVLSFLSPAQSFPSEASFICVSFWECSFRWYTNTGRVSRGRIPVYNARSMETPEPRWRQGDKQRLSTASVYLAPVQTLPESANTECAFRLMQCCRLWMYHF